jgi:hypothetical protein
VLGGVGGAVIVPGVVFSASLPARLLEWLYTVTGQQEPEPPGMASALAEAGLTLERERERMGMAEALIAVATKK